jgi:hypothetical protein
LLVLLDNAGIEACAGSPDALVAAIAAAAAEQKLLFA